MEFWPGAARNTAQLGVEIKGDGSPVSKADFASNDLIVSELRRLFPADHILSEEIPRDPSTPADARLWIIDPLDGTNSFLHGNDDFSVLVSLCSGPEPLAGWLFFPARNSFAFAIRGGAATVNGSPAQVSSCRSPRTERVYVRNVELTRTGLAYPRWLDSGAAMLALATGEFDAVIIRLLTHREWDLAAPAALIEAAGGRVSDELGKPFAFNTAGILPQYFIASNGALHDEVLHLIPGPADKPLP